MSESRCTTHHHGCDCREAKIKRLVQTVREYMELSNWPSGCVDHDRLEENMLIVMKEWEGEFE